MVRLTRSNWNTAPTEKFVASSESSGLAPSAIATGLVAGKVVTSYGTPLTKFVEVVVKNCCCSDGARKPVEYEARSAKPSAMSYRPATLPETLLPKSE